MAAKAEAEETTVRTTAEPTAAKVLRPRTRVLLPGGRARCGADGPNAAVSADVMYAFPVGTVAFVRNARLRKKGECGLLARLLRQRIPR